MANASQTREANKILQAALDEISDKFGLERVTADIRRFRGDGGLKVMAVSMFNASNAAEQPKATAVGASAPLARAVEMFKIKSVTNRKGDTLVDYRSTSPKYPFVYQSARGARWKITVEEAQQRFGRA